MQSISAKYRRLRQRIFFQPKIAAELTQKLPPFIRLYWPKRPSAGSLVNLPSNIILKSMLVNEVEGHCHHCLQG